MAYLLKKTPPARLLDAIREAAGGGAPMSPEIARKVVTLFRKTPSAERPAEALTAQELRLLQLRFSPAPCRRQGQRAWIR